MTDEAKALVERANWRTTGEQQVADELREIAKGLPCGQRQMHLEIAAQIVEQGQFLHPNDFVMSIELAEANDRIETQAREIERLKAEVMRQMQWKTEAQNDADEMAAALDNIANESSDTWAREKASAALAGDSHE